MRVDFKADEESSYHPRISLVHIRPGTFASALSTLCAALKCALGFIRTRQ